MALTVPDFQPVVGCSISVSILDANVSTRIDLSQDQIATMTDEDLQTKVDTLVQAMGALCPGMDVQYVIAWSSSANVGAWQTAPTGTSGGNTE